MTYEQWLQHGIDNGYVQPVCLTHDFQTIWTTKERELFNDMGDDPCVARWVTKHDLA